MSKTARFNEILESVASEQFKVAFIGAAGAVPTITLTPLVTQVTPENVKCCNRAFGVSLATPLTIAATFPATPTT